MTAQRGRNILLRIEIHLSRWWAEAYGERGEDEQALRLAIRTVQSLRISGKAA